MGASLLENFILREQARSHNLIGPGADLLPYCTAHSFSLALPTPRPDEVFWLMLVGIVT